jgi:peptidoglycan/LPS O-acetylase OafA/YrhL
MFFIRALKYLFIVLLCITGYLLSTSIIADNKVTQVITYTSSDALEVKMAWLTTEKSLPEKNFWPENSHLKDGLIYSKMAMYKGQFRTKLTLPSGTIVNYWMVQTKDKDGKATEVWDSGGENNQYFTTTFSYSSFFKPGYFIFLAGFLPLLLYYHRNRGKQNPDLGRKESHSIKAYIPQLDSIRTIAVLLVIIHHWLPKSFFLNYIPNGALGVNLFFVLSGFLITGILLKSKRHVESQQLKKATVFKNFYIRRTLRIFPIYYLFLFVFLLLNGTALREHGAYFFTYTSNYLFYSNQQFLSDHLAHLWSLAVEEQFYILWPWLIIFISRRLLPYLIALFIIIGISSNYIFTEKDWWVEILTPACFEAFAVGGFLSYLSIYRPDIIKQIQPKFAWIFAAALLLFISDVFGYSFLPRRTYHSILAAAIIFYCVHKNNNKAANYVLNNKWMISIGKISYGIYLYHLCIPELWKNVNTKFSSWNIDLFFNKAMPATFKPAWLFTQHLALVLLISIVSWKLIEKPFNNLKKRFEYKPGFLRITSQTQVATAGVLTRLFRSRSLAKEE